MSGFDPPKWPADFLKKLLPLDTYEELMGDMDELFSLRVEEKGLKYARRRYIWDTVKALRLINASEVSRENTGFILFLSYIKTGIRFLWRTRNYSSINILGLAFGITAACLANLFITDQFSFDRFHSKIDRIYRLNIALNFSGQEEIFGGSSYRMGEEFPNKIPGIEATSRIKSGYGILKLGEQNLDQRFHFVDPEIFEILDFEWIRGNESHFGDPSKVVVSESFFKKIGEREELTLSLKDEEKRFTIVGIIKDFPINSTLSPRLLVPMEQWITTVHERRTTNWLDINMNLLVLKDENASVEAIDGQMTELASEGDEDFSEGEGRLYLHRFDKIHSATDIYTGNGLNPTISEELLWVISIVGILCLFISGLNYSNFSLGHFLIRSREVGVRKILGARPHFVWHQFFTETMISTILALMIAFVLVGILLPYFSEFVEIPYRYSDLFKGKFILGCLAIFLLATFLSGSYPSLILSRFKTVRVLKGSHKVGGKNIASRVFLTSQVGLAIFLIIGTITVNRQLNYLLDFDLGYSDERLISVDLPANSEDRLERFRILASGIPGVESISANSGYNGTSLSGDLAEKGRVRHIHVDENFVDQLQLEIIEGRNFDPALKTDKENSVLINQTLLNKIELEDPIGQTLPFSYGDLVDPTIVGIVRDYHFDAPKYDRSPLVIYLSPQYPYQEILIKMKPSFSGKDFSEIEKAWNEIFDPYPFSYDWIEDSNAAKMKAEIKIRDIAMIGSAISIMLVVFGLLSVLGTYIQQRMKEIVIRKINGSRTSDLLILFARRFSIWLGLGFLVGAWPAYYFLQEWLNDYATRVEMNLGIAVLALVVCGLVFIGTLLYQMIKISRVNPVIFLSDE